MVMPAKGHLGMYFIEVGSQHPQGSRTILNLTVSRDCTMWQDFGANQWALASCLVVTHSKFSLYWHHHCHLTSPPSSMRPTDAQPCRIERLCSPAQHQVEADGGPPDINGAAVSHTAHDFTRELGGLV